MTERPGCGTETAGTCCGNCVDTTGTWYAWPGLRTVLGWRRAVGTPPLVYGTRRRAPASRRSRATTDGCHPWPGARMAHALPQAARTLPPLSGTPVADV